MKSRFPLVLLLLVAATGCIRGAGGAAFGRALWTAAVVGMNVAVAVHDVHAHEQECGHYRTYYQGRWVYWYDDHWEYYDEPTARWYRYEQ